MELHCINSCGDSSSDNISLVTNNYYTPTNSDSSVSGLLQIDCSFIKPPSVIISSIVSSINNGSKSEYLNAAGVLLESCISRSLMYLRSIKIQSPICTNLNYMNPECSFEDPTPEDDTYIKNNGKYDNLQYMCDYIKYCMLGNDETIEEKNEEEKLMESEVKFLLKKRNKMMSEIKILLKSNRMIPNNKNKETASISELTTNMEVGQNTQCHGNYTALVTGIRKAIERRLVSKSTFVTMTKDKSSPDEVNVDLFIGTEVRWGLIDRFKFSNLIKERKLLRNTDINARDNCIVYFMKYYLSLRSKLELVARTKFKDTNELIINELNLPVPDRKALKSYDLYEAHPFSGCCPYYARPYYANSNFKISDDMELVKERMDSYLANSKCFSAFPNR
ncbi:MULTISPECIES: hypothetical protein [Candidatus Ichthyocystis]|uniref:Putative coiled coil protein n=1 Tax=Candidatus Ichthyocystis hellenicum TaxID=1561003 RepID=A0A0S4M4N6_9BURK|nr:MULTISPECIES: hypothetical protein [Ichthyocystis]CUT17967.1 putative coiled coil protein [Candidatus Ichthyocystis hellenicum]